MLTTWFDNRTNLVDALDTTDVKFQLLRPDSDTDNTTIEIFTNYLSVRESQSLFSFDSFLVVFQTTVCVWLNLSQFRFDSSVVDCHFVVFWLFLAFDADWFRLKLDLLDFLFQIGKLLLKLLQFLHNLPYLRSIFQ